MCTGNDPSGERGDPVFKTRGANAKTRERAIGERSLAQIHRGSQKFTDRSRKVSKSSSLLLFENVY